MSAVEQARRRVPDSAHRHLAIAQRIRMAGVELRERITAGELDVVDVLLEPPAEARAMRIVQLLRAQNKWRSSERSWRLLARLAIPESKPVGELTDRQRRVLVNALRGEGAR